MAHPLAYLITFSCYGARLHGDEPASVDRNHNRPGSRYAVPDAQRLAGAEARMKEAPYILNEAARRTVLQSIQQLCSKRNWTLIAAHVRTNHVHAVVDADQLPEAVMHDFKAFATRGLNQLEERLVRIKRWTRHGSTRYLWKHQEVSSAIRYVVTGQGEPMAVFPLVEGKTAPCCRGSVGVQ